MARGKQRKYETASADTSHVTSPDTAGRQTRERFGVWLRIALFALVAVVAAFFVYDPALQGPFVFDDYALPFRSPSFRSESLRQWMSSVRPLLMLSYWLNYQVSGREATLSYHVVNVLIHSGNTVLVGAILWRMLHWTPARVSKRLSLAAAGTGIFLLHPLQSESVAYIAGRSESLSAFWSLCAWCLFLYWQPSSLTWKRAIVILVLFAAAVSTKEHAVALAGVLLLTDILFSGEPFIPAIRRNWRLYAPLTAGAMLACVAVWRVLSVSTSAGLNVPGIRWYEYAFTQPKVLLLYLRLAVLPVGLTVDHDFALSRSLLDGGTILAFLFWIGAGAAAWVYRRRYPVASFGCLVFLILLAPTSSLIPIKDLAAERRMYLPLLGLVLIALDLASRVKVAVRPLAAMSACVLVSLGAAAYQRNKAWGDSEALWESAISATPSKARPYGNLAAVYLSRRQCSDALDTLQRAEHAVADLRDAHLLATWAVASECAGNPAEGVNKMRQSISIQPTAQGYASLGRMYLDSGNLADADRALSEAERLDPGWDMTYVYRSQMSMARNDYQTAALELQRALSLNPNNRRALQLIQETGARSRSAR